MSLKANAIPTSLRAMLSPHWGVLMMPVFLKKPKASAGRDLALHGHQSRVNRNTERI